MLFSHGAWKKIASTSAPRYRATVSVRFTILGSGSSGNCAYVETENSRVLVDAGFTPRQIRQRLATIGRTPENLSAILRPRARATRKNPNRSGIVAVRVPADRRSVSVTRKCHGSSLARRNARSGTN